MSADAREGSATVLVVQDDEGNRELAEQVLRAEGWSVVATAGPPTLDLVRAHGPNLVVLDGHDTAFIRDLRASEAATTPVVLWTASVLAPDTIAALRSEYTPLAVVQKPKAMPELPHVIRSLLTWEETPGRLAGKKQVSVTGTTGDRDVR